MEATMNRPNPNQSMVVMFLILTFVIVLAASLGVVQSSHADKHIECDDIRNALSTRGVAMIYKHQHEPIYYLVCQINDTRWGIQPCTAEGCEKTAFSPGDMSLKAIKDYLERFCVRFKGVLPWLK